MQAYTPKISIIVPIFNAEKYLHRCIGSVLNQSYKEWELILIDDGSCDNSASICTSYSKLDNRIHTVIKENQGVSAARNTGIEKCSGDWIQFLDADDWLEGNALQTIVSTIRFAHSDLVYFDFFIHNSKESYIYHTSSATDKSTIIKDFIDGEWTVIWNICAKKELYNSHSIRFNTCLQFNEDYNVAIKLLLVAEILSKTAEPLYNYDRTNLLSAVNMLTSEKYYSQTQISQHDVISFAQKYNVHNSILKQLKNRLLQDKQWMLMDYSYFDVFRNYCKPCNDFYIFSCPNYSIKQKVAGFLILKHLFFIPHLFLLLKKKHYE